MVGKFTSTMPKLELLGKNFILQTQLSGGVKIAHFNSRHVYIDLDNELDYIIVWTKQKMTIEGKIMSIQKWTPTFRPEQETPIVPIWISLSELPWHCYTKEFVTILLKDVGNVLYLDSASVQKTRESMAKVKVQIDLTKARPPHVWMGIDEDDYDIERWQAIEYEGIPDYSMYCRHQGHPDYECYIKKRDEEYKKRRESEMEKRNKDKPGQEHVNKREQVNQNYKEAGNSSHNAIQHQQREQNNNQQEDQWKMQRRKNNRVIYTKEQNPKDAQGQTAAEHQQHNQGNSGNNPIPIHNNYIDISVQDQPNLQDNQELQIKEKEKEPRRQPIRV